MSSTISNLPQDKIRLKPSLKSKQPVNLARGLDIVATFSRKSKNTDTKSAQKQRFKVNVTEPGTQRVHVPRNIDALQRITSIGNFPIFHPTVNTSNSDYSILVSNPAGEPQGVILVHREHLCNNLQYFKAIFDEKSNFRESTKNQSELVTPYSPELINDYFSAIYDHPFYLNAENCLGFYHTADYYNDEGMLPPCIAFIKDNMQESMIFDLLQQTSAFDSACVEYVKSNGIGNIAQHRQKIGRLSASQFQNFFQQIAGSVTTVEKISLLSYWIEVNHNCIEIIAGVNYYDLTSKERFNFLQFIKNKLTDSDFSVAYTHVIGAAHISADRFLQYMGQNQLILTDMNSPNRHIDYTNMDAVLRTYVDMKITFRIGRRIDDYFLAWKAQKLKWVPFKELNSEDGEFTLDQRSEGYIIRHSISTDFALTAPFLGHPPDNTTVKLSQWLGNDNQKLQITADVQGNGFVKLSFVQDSTKFIAGKLQPALFSSLAESNPMIHAQAWLKFHRV